MYSIHGRAVFIGSAEFLGAHGSFKNRTLTSMPIAGCLAECFRACSATPSISTSYFGSILASPTALYRHRRRHIHGAGMDLPGTQNDRLDMPKRMLIGDGRLPNILKHYFSCRTLTSEPTAACSKSSVPARRDPASAA